MKHKKAVFIIFPFLFFFLAWPVRAELRYFRLAYKRCCRFSLNENLSQITQGKIGPDCDFYVDLYAQGEWEKVSGYFDTPPYGWGGDVIGKHSCYEDFNVSFTCSQPNYQLDSSLPSYVIKTGEESLDQGSSFAYPKGKRYKFHVSNSAPTSGSFNLSFSFSSNCQMRTKNSSYYRELYDPAPAVGGTSGCQAQSPININPRGTTLTIPFSITDICGPSPTPTITPTPTNTPTPTPTNTPTPTLTPTITPTPIPPASCACYLLTSDSSNPTAVQKGETLNFTAEAFVDTPDTAKVKEMIFVLERDDVEVVRSGAITSTFDRTEVIDGKNVDVYKSTWSYLADTSGLYRLELIINCAWKQAFGGSRVLGTARDYYLNLKESQPTPQPEADRSLDETLTPVLAKPQSQETGFLSFLRNIINFFAGYQQEPTPPIQQQGGTALSIPTVTVIAPRGDTIKLGTFEPLPVAKDCTEMYFRVVD